MKRRAFHLPLLLALLFLSVLLSLLIGEASMSPDRFLGGLFAREGYETESAILLYIRLPRALGAVVAGAALALAGVLLQHVMGNPLASPNTVGVNAGAGFFTILTLSLFPTATALLPMAASLGAFLTALLILSVSGSVGGGRGTVILAGIACTSLFQAGISFFSLLDTDVLASYSAFSIGGLAGVTLSSLLLPAILLLAVLLAALCLARPLTALSLGDGAAAALGVRVRLVRTVAILLASVAAGAAISFAGLLGFVGLAVPHIGRRLFGHGLGRELLTAPLLGGILLVLADLLARTMLSPSDIPVGILTSLLGAPFFLILLLQKRRAHDA